MCSKESIVLFPFMAQGHIIPFLSLALKLEQETNFTITLINTPLNINKLKQTLPNNSTIRLLQIPFSAADHGLPPDTETTENLPGPLIRLLIESSAAALKPAFRDLISQIRPVCVIADMFFAWTAEIARESNALHAIFIASGGYGISGWAATCLSPARTKESDAIDFFLPGFPKDHRTIEAKDLPETARMPWEYGREILRDWKKTEAMLFNTVEDIDQIGLNYFRKNFTNCPVSAIGPILNRTQPQEKEENGTKSHHQCMEWLGSKPKNSVLYVAFGSQNSPSEAQTLELAKALEASNANFLWVFRPPSGLLSPKNKNKDCFLPTGFEGRVRASDKGLLVHNWAPQLEILAHQSVCAFLSHCGWNSIMEALSNGIPMLTWPMGGDQPFNARFWEEEIGACVGVASGTVCVVKYEDIVRKIELIMKDDQSNLVRRKASMVREMIGNATCRESGHKGSSVEAMERFVNIFLQTRKKNGSV